MSERQPRSQDSEHCSRVASIAGLATVALLALLIAVLAVLVPKMVADYGSGEPGDQMLVLKDDLTPAIHTLAFTPDGSHLLAAGSRRGALETRQRPRVITLWRVSDGRRQTYRDLSCAVVHSIAFSPTRNWLAVGCSGNLRQQSWATKNNRMTLDTALILGPAGESIRTFPIEGPVRAVAFSSDGELLATGGEDCIVRFWDVESGEELRALDKQESWINSVAYSPDDTQLAVCLHNGAVRLWNITSGEMIQEFRPGGHNFKSANLTLNVAFSPDGAWLAAAGHEETISIWNVSSAREVYSLSGHESRVDGVTFSPDGKYLASAGSDKTVRVWDLDQGREWLKLEGHTAPVYCVAFDRSGTCLASGSEDQTVRIWRIRPIELTDNNSQ